MKDVVIVIPTLDPDEKIMNDFIDKLQKEFKNILVVNDGSNESHNGFFNSLEKKGITVLKHYKNYGKGRGLKNAFNYILNEYPNIKGVVTCDSDGQHSVSDIKKCADALIKNPDKLILGVRNFDKENVPARSKFGNKITRNIFKIFIGLDISDTQTGLRGLSKKIMIEFLDISGERYEYETNMLIECQKKNIELEEIEIETIYINSNEGSHFNPIKDSIKIYRLFLNYFIITFSIFMLDILLFIGLYNILNINSKILAATIVARFISSLYYYLVNANLVFKNIKIKQLIKYYILVIIQMFLSGCFVTYLFDLLNINVVLIKVIVDIILWLIVIIVQKEFVFKGEEK